MAVPVFGLAHSDIRAHYFPTLAAFGTSTTPTATAVGEMITDAAAVLGGRLARRGLSVSALSADAGATYPLAYAWCRKFIRTMAGVGAYRALMGGGAVPDAWALELARMERELEEFGLSALGDAPAPAQDAQGPRSHIANHSLDTGDSQDISDAIPRFRKSDAL